MATTLSIIKISLSSDLGHTSFSWQCLGVTAACREAHCRSYPRGTPALSCLRQSITSSSASRWWSATRDPMSAAPPPLLPLGRLRLPARALEAGEWAGDPPERPVLPKPESPSACICVITWIGLFTGILRDKVVSKQEARGQEGSGFGRWMREGGGRQ